MFFKNAINKKNVCITLCRPPPFLGCSAAEIRRVYSNLPYINLEKNRRPTFFKTSFLKEIYQEITFTVNKNANN